VVKVLFTKNGEQLTIVAETIEEGMAIRWWTEHYQDWRNVLYITSPPPDDDYELLIKES